MIKLPARLKVRLARPAARCHRALPPPSFAGLPSGRVGKPFYVVRDGAEILSLVDGEAARCRSPARAWEAAAAHLEAKGEII